MDREDYGRLFAYDKSYDRVTTKIERPLQPLDRMKYNPTTSDDPVIQQVMPLSRTVCRNQYLMFALAC